MKIGDRLICKKYDFDRFVKGESYYIKSIREIRDCTVIRIYYSGDRSMIFVIDERYESINEPYIYSFFYTKEELRSIKLESL